ncbi:hypothetical protein GF351_06270 [Candidatus Woesearchaeota archaeon]|nr:hypothetical protein [Candidatus Woesearchaeota archaeon]
MRSKSHEAEEEYRKASHGDFYVSRHTVSPPKDLITLCRNRGIELYQGQELFSWFEVMAMSTYFKTFDPCLRQAVQETLGLRADSSVCFPLNPQEYEIARFDEAICDEDNGTYGHDPRGPQLRSLISRVLPAGLQNGKESAPGPEKEFTNDVFIFSTRGIDRLMASNLLIQAGYSGSLPVIIREPDVVAAKEYAYSYPKGHTYAQEKHCFTGYEAKVGINTRVIGYSWPEFDEERTCFNSHQFGEHGLPAKLGDEGERRIHTEGLPVMKTGDEYVLPRDYCGMRVMYYSQGDIFFINPWERAARFRIAERRIKRRIDLSFLNDFYERQS